MAEWLARESTANDVHHSAKWFCVEGFKVRPQRCFIQLFAFHLLNQVPRSEGFDLHISDSSHIWENASESKVDTSVACA